MKESLQVEVVTYDCTTDHFIDGVTNFSTEAFIDAGLQMGGAESHLLGVVVHPEIMGRMKKCNLIDQALGHESFLGYKVVVSDVDTKQNGNYVTWLISQFKIAKLITQEY